MARVVVMLLTVVLAAQVGTRAQAAGEEPANIEAEEKSLQQASNKLDGELAGSEPKDPAAPTSAEESEASPTFAELLSCRRELDQEESKQLELRSEAEGCQRQLDRLHNRIATAEKAVDRRDGLRAKAGEESERAVVAEKDALQLMEKEQEMKDSAALACDKQIEVLNATNAAAIAEAKKTVAEHMEKIKEAEAQMEVKIQTEEANAISNAEHQAEGEIAAKMHDADAAVSGAQADEAEAIATATEQAKREELSVSAESLKEIEEKKKALHDKLERTQQERDEAVKKLTDEKDTLSATLEDLQAEVDKAEKAAEEAADARTIAEKSFAKLKQYATGMISSTQNAVNGAETVANAALSSTKTPLGPSLDAEIEAAHAAAKAANEATSAAQPIINGMEVARAKEAAKEDSD